MIKYFIYIFKKDFLTLLGTAILLLIGNFSLQYTPAINSGLFKFIVFILYSIYIFFLIYRCIEYVTADLFNNRKYFTYTLPLSKYSIQFGKLLYALVYSIIMVSTLIFIICISKNNMEIFNIKTSNIILFIFTTSSTCLFIYSIANISFVLGKIFTNSKMVCGFLAMILIIFATVFDTNSVTKLFNFFNLENETIAILVILAIHLVYSIILTFISSYLLDKKLEV
ncbi:hypothetical protein QQA45_06875 [Sneathia sanguinegens]|uniref:ABC transporter permease n=1 Tax=Sneathia sanguinegens TaxID=40543 RepID=A0ABT7HMR5_9FUSO|nr:hypothetical protein [Sneathia sanguinegens]MDK9581201.1 hypothetical protein [Sneathia sanguinegens]